MTDDELVAQVRPYIGRTVRPPDWWLRAYLREHNPGIGDDEVDALDLSIFDCGGCG